MVMKMYTQAFGQLILHEQNLKPPSLTGVMHASTYA